jgi:hypothetical protein
VFDDVFYCGVDDASATVKPISEIWTLSSVLPPEQAKKPDWMTCACWVGVQGTSYSLAADRASG